MAYSFNPSIVQNGLILNIDAASLKSYSGTGTIWKDTSGNGNNCTLVNSPTYNTAPYSFSFNDASGQYAASISNLLPAAAYTKVVWFNLSAYVSSNNIVGGGNSAQHTLWMYGGSTLNSGHNSVWNQVVGATTINLNTWYCGAVTFSNVSGWVLYVNGVVDGTNSSTTMFTGNNPGEILIGAFANGNLISGKVADVQIYNRALSATEVKQNYNALKGRYGL